MAFILKIAHVAFLLLVTNSTESLSEDGSCRTTIKDGKMTSTGNCVKGRSVFQELDAKLEVRACHDGIKYDGVCFRLLAIGGRTTNYERAEELCKEIEAQPSGLYSETHMQNLVKYFDGKVVQSNEVWTGLVPDKESDGKTTFRNPDDKIAPTTRLRKTSGREIGDKVAIRIADGLITFTHELLKDSEVVFGVLCERK